ncbi:MAG: desulfoferrodoxin [Acidobacteriota bacterium]
MKERLQVYRCSVCGNMVEVIHASKGQLECCGELMKLLVENTVDASREKHIPVVEIKDDGILVKVGSVPHPMEEKHYIEWIELIADKKVYRQYLRPDDKPEAFFPVKLEKVSAREYCNLHGLWRG